MSGGSTRVGFALSGTAVVCCVHDREKRKVTTESQVAAIGLMMEPPVLYDPKIHKIHRCSCCENLFVDYGDEPRFCRPCHRPVIHLPGGPLPEPKGVVDG